MVLCWLVAGALADPFRVVEVVLTADHFGVEMDSIDAELCLQIGSTGQEFNKGSNDLLIIRCCRYLLSKLVKERSNTKKQLHYFHQLKPTQVQSIRDNKIG